MTLLWLESMLSALLLVGAVHLAAGLSPNCRYVPRTGRGGGGEPQDGIICSCRGEGLPAYEGNLNFLKSVLSAVPADRR